MSYNIGDNFRHKAILYIDDALKKSANKIGSQNEKSAAEIEDRIFGRSNNRDNYMSMVARIILHCEQGGQNQPQPAPTMNQGPMMPMMANTKMQRSVQMMDSDPNALRADSPLLPKMLTQPSPMSAMSTPSPKIPLYQSPSPAPVQQVKQTKTSGVWSAQVSSNTAYPSPSPIISFPSPAGHSPDKTNLSDKEKQYVEKVTQMSVYIEPLQKRIAEMQNNVDVANKDSKYLKLKRLLSVLRGKERVCYQNLLRVEYVLRRNLPVNPQKSLDTRLPNKRPINNAHAETSKKRIRLDGEITTANKIINSPPKLTGNVDFKVDVIVNTTNDKVDLNANHCGKALLKVAGAELLNECKKIGSLMAGDMASTGPAKLNCKRVYHVRSSSWSSGIGAPILRTLIKKCLYQMEKDKLRSIAIPAIGTGAQRFPRLEVAKIFFEEVTGHLIAHPQIDEVHFVVFDQATVDTFLGAVQQIKSVILSPPSQRAPVPLPKSEVISNAGSPNNVTFTEKLDGSLELSLGTTNLTVQIVWADIVNESTDLIMHVIRKDSSFQGGVSKALVTAGGDSIVQEFKALGQPAPYSTQYTKAGRLAVHQIAHVIAPASIEVAELKKCVATFFDDVLKKNISRISFSAIGVDAMGYSESQSADLIFDNLSRIAERKNSTLSLVRIVICEEAKLIKFKDATEAYFASWVVTRLKPPIERKFQKFNLSTSSQEYQDVETVFHKSVSNHIVRIEKIQNKEIYELYNVKRRAMMNKFGSNFAGKELWLFHGTSLQSVDKINANGLNRSYAGTHATSYGKGVYFARDASYSCRLTYSPRDWQGLRYIYYAKVLVGDYTRGNSGMIARPSKDTADPDETYDSVVDNISDPNIYVLFQDYEYYTEYLITFL